MILRNARPEEAEACYRCLDDARNFQQEQGFLQWSDHYPTFGIVQQDLKDGVGYVFEEDGEILGYCCLLVGDDPLYHVIDGAWRTDRPYAVVHRMGFLRRYSGKGLSVPAFAAIRRFCAERGIHAIRMDTQAENARMRHIAEREGFVFCGTVDFDGPKLAFEWDD